LKNKFFSLINIGGLALGMTVALLIGLWIHDEVSYNKNHDGYDRIVQVLRKSTSGGGIFVGGALPGMTSVYLADNFDNYFEHVAATFFRSNPQTVQVEDRTFEEMGYYFQPDIPHLLTLKMTSGTLNSLEDPSNIMISESLASKLFGDTPAFGNFVTLNGSRQLQVAGIYEDLPHNSSFSDAGFFASLQLIYNEDNPYVWDNYNMKVFGTLRPNVDLEDASLAIKEVLNSRLEDPERSTTLQLLPMKDWHLRSYFKDGEPATSQRLQFLRLYSLIGIFVLLIACINFMNLNTARYQTRAKEVGIRKAMGSYRSKLVGQFLTESMLYALTALVVALAAVVLLLPWFNDMADKQIAFPWTSIRFWPICLLFALVCGLIAGSYPSIMLSSFDPIRALKGNLSQGRGSALFRKVLVVFQFTVSVVLIVGTITVYRQIAHAKNRPTGYEQERLVTVVGRSDEFYAKQELIRAELLKTGVVEEVGYANYPLTNTLGNNNGFGLRGEAIPFSATFNTIFVSPYYGAATRWELVMGRDFNPDLDEKASIIVSESAVAAMGLDDPIGKEITSRNERNGHKIFRIIGVVRDMIKGSPFEPPVPLMLFNANFPPSYSFVRIRDQVDLSEALGTIEATYKSVAPSNPFNFQFVDDAYLTKFRSEEQLGGLAAFFSVLAVLISCLGLLGLSAYVVNQRVKEIGIRKVLGATTPQLWRMLSSDFGLLVVIACTIAIPLSWYVMTGWLEDYEYKVSVSGWTLAFGALSCVIITIATVSYHSLKASLANPVQSLRSE
ncbi:MAG: ABC transporter permease, partial [Bacteroidota bacterium]